MAFHYTPPLTRDQFFSGIARSKYLLAKKKLDSLFDTENLGESGDLGFTSRPWRASSWISYAGSKKSKNHLTYLFVGLILITGLLAMLVGGCPIGY